ncbi:MAG TPA: hypothetical protein VJ949_05970 [Cryomorphaceae bacterium]|nr:hypothetical protein [Cryomorphaceae bacterium]
MNLNWKQRLLSSQVEFFRDDQKIGELKEGFFKKEGEGFFNELKIEFTKSDLFSQNTDIIDTDASETIGKVKFNGWRNEAEIRLGERTLQWKYLNFLGTKWQILENDQSIVEYKSSWFSGEIEATSNEEALILAGFFVHSNFVKILVVIAVVMIVVLSN